MGSPFLHFKTRKYLGNVACLDILTGLGQTFKKLYGRSGFHAASSRNEHQGISLGVKCGRRVELTTLPLYT